jgi:hypothetical protein
MVKVLRMFRYSARRYICSLLSMGIIRVGTLYDFRRLEHKKGIADPQEGKKVVSHWIDQLQIADTEDPNIKSNIDFRALELFRAVKINNSKNITIRNVTLSQSFDVPDCFILCTSKICSKETMFQFEGADSCVEIVEIESFYRVLTNTLNSIIPVIPRGIHEVIYQNREEQWNGQDWGRHPALIKGTKFKEQGELRAIWQPRLNKPISPINVCNYRMFSFCL